MCNPLLLAVGTFAAGAAKSMAAYGAANEDFANNQANAIVAKNDEQRQLTLRQVQEEEAYQQKAKLTELRMVEDKADASVNATMRGGGGLSLAGILADIGRKAGNDLQTHESNWKMTARQLQYEKDATVTKATGRINSVRRGSPLGLAGDIAGSALSSYSSFKSM